MPFICTSLLIYRNIVTDIRVPKFVFGSFSKETVSKVILSALANCRLQWNLSYIQISSVDSSYLYRQNILINKVVGPMSKSGPRNTVCYQHRMKSTYRPVSLADKIMSPCPLLPCSLFLLSLLLFSLCTFLTVFRLSCFISFCQCTIIRITH